VPQSLHRTWAALAVAALAVLVVAILAGRDFVRNVNAPCPGAILQQEIPLSSGPAGTLDATTLTDVATRNDPSAAPVASGPAFQLIYDQKAASRYGYTTEYKNVRIAWKEPQGETDCTCGAVAIMLSGEAPSDLRLYRVRGTNQYVVKGRPGYSQSGDSDIRAIFTIEPRATHHIQLDRIFSRQHLPLGVVVFAFGALVVALFRSRRAMSYALRIHTWNEGRLTPDGLIEGEAGVTLGTLEQTRMRQIPPGPVLVAPEALHTTGLYRDVPIVARRHVAEGTHARWASGTMVRLRDARALAVISTACTLLALGARLIA
jgi:hypothetical protein